MVQGKSRVKAQKILGPCNPGEKGNNETRPRSKVRKSANLLSDGDAALFNKLWRNPKHGFWHCAAYDGIALECSLFRFQKETCAALRAMTGIE
jgi:hypothetical protein